MNVFLFTNLRPKPRIRFQKPAYFRSSLGGSVVVDMIFSFLTD